MAEHTPRAHPISLGFILMLGRLGDNELGYLGPDGRVLRIRLKDGDGASGRPYRSVRCPLFELAGARKAGTGASEGVDSPSYPAWRHTRMLEKVCVSTFVGLVMGCENM